MNYRIWLAMSNSKQIISNTWNAGIPQVWHRPLLELNGRWQAKDRPRFPVPRLPTAHIVTYVNVNMCHKATSHKYQRKSINSTKSHCFTVSLRGKNVKNQVEGNSMWNVKLEPAVCPVMSQLKKSKSAVLSKWKCTDLAGWWVVSQQCWPHT